MRLMWGIAEQEPEPGTGGDVEADARAFGQGVPVDVLLPGLAAVLAVADVEGDQLRARRAVGQVDVDVERRAVEDRGERTAGSSWQEQRVVDRTWAGFRGHRRDAAGLGPSRGGDWLMLPVPPCSLARRSPRRTAPTDRRG